MEKKQYELCLEILRRFHSAGILKNIIIIGSWCIYFYKYYFTDQAYIDLSTVKTRDIDFLVPIPVKTDKKVNVPNLLKDLGFVIDFKSSKGYIKLDHPALIIEFLVPEKGKGIDKPYPLPEFGLNAQALRFLLFLTDDLIRVKVEDILITLPHPANFALHKLIIFQRRAKEEKAIKDRRTAIDILRTLIKTGESEAIKKAFRSIPQKWQKKILKGLEEAGEIETLGKVVSGLDMGHTEKTKG